MIQPSEILQKAVRLYPDFLTAWLEGNEFFPRAIPASRRPDNDLAIAAMQVQELRNASKEKVGYGYTVEWREINSRTYGKNEFPSQILFATQSDFLKYLEKEREFDEFRESVLLIRSKHPALEGWVRSHRAAIIELAGSIDGLLAVVAYLKAHPRPNVFARELPLSVDTKFIERHRPVLREWRDLILPPHTIAAHENHFERRFGLRHADPHLLLRFLDPDLQRASGSPWPELSLPLRSLAELQIRPRQVLIVENKVNLLTLPELRGTLALGGLGNGVVDLGYVPWLNSCSLSYWGDIDVEGLVILARLRSVFPLTKSVMMDAQTLRRWRQGLALPGSGGRVALPVGLTAQEADAFRICADNNIRLEQERLPQSFVSNVLQELNVAP